MTEYPRWIYSTQGEAKVVMTEAERNALAGDWYDTPTERDNAQSKPKAFVEAIELEIDEGDLKTRLYAIAEQKGIKIDKRWKLEKLIEVVGE